MQAGTETYRELVREARRGDDRALASLVASFRPLAASVASHFYLPGGTREDVFQEAMVGLVKAIRDYDLESHLPFPVFCKVCVRRQVMTAIKIANRRKHEPMNRSVSLDARTVNRHGERRPMYEVLSSAEPDTALLVVSMQGVSRVNSILDENLTSMEKAVLAFFMKGMSYDEIAKRTASTWKGVDNAMQRVRRKVRFHLTAAERTA